MTRLETVLCATTALLCGSNASISQVQAASLDAETAIRPFHIDVPEQALLELRARVQATRLPDKETVQNPSQGARRAFPTLSYFHEVDKGGHFAAWEQPELFATELRAAFRPMR